MNQTVVIAGLRELQQEAHQIAVDHGWWDDQRNIGEALLKIVGEVVEGLQALENGNPADKHLAVFDAFTVEMADVVIRVCDLSGAMNLPLPEAILAKIAFNRGREYRHGKAF